MIWNQRSAEEILNDAERRKEGKDAPGFIREFRYCEIGDMITLLMAGGQLKSHNMDTGREYEHIVQYAGYSFLNRTYNPLPDGILNRNYRQ